MWQNTWQHLEITIFEILIDNHFENLYSAKSVSGKENVKMFEAQPVSRAIPGFKVRTASRKEKRTVHYRFEEERGCLVVTVEACRDEMKSKKVLGFLHSRRVIANPREWNLVSAESIEGEATPMCVFEYEKK